MSKYFAQEASPPVLRERLFQALTSVTATPAEVAQSVRLLLVNPLTATQSMVDEVFSALNSALADTTAGDAEGLRTFTDYAYSLELLLEQLAQAAASNSTNSTNSAATGTGRRLLQASAGLNQADTVAGLFALVEVWFNAISKDLLVLAGEQSTFTQSLLATLVRRDHELSDATFTLDTDFGSATFSVTNALTMLKDYRLVLMSPNPLAPLPSSVLPPITPAAFVQVVSVADNAELLSDVTVAFDYEEASCEAPLCVPTCALWNGTEWDVNDAATLAVNRTDATVLCGFETVLNGMERPVAVIARPDLSIPPSIRIAQVTDDALSIRVFFALPTDLAGQAAGVDFFCDRILESSTVDLLANPSTALCQWVDSDLLLIHLGALDAIVPGDAITVLPDILRSQGSVSDAATAATSPLVASETPIAPLASLQGPALVGSCSDFTLTAEASNGGAGRALVITWAFLGNATAYPELAQLLDNTNTNQSTRVVVPSLTAPPSASSVLYPFSLTAANWLGFEDTALLNVEKISADLPEVTFDPIGIADRYLDLTVNTTVVGSSCENNRSSEDVLLLEWSTVYPLPNDTAFFNASELATAAQEDLFIPKNTLIPGISYTLRLTVQDVSSGLANSNTVLLLVAPVPTPEVTEARFGDDGSSIFVQFDASTQPLACASVLTPTSLFDLGGTPVCSWSLNTTLLTIIGFGNSTDPTLGFFVGDQLTLQAGLLSADGFSEPSVATAVEVKAPFNPPTVSALLSGPNSLSKDDYLLQSGALSLGGASRALTYTWSIADEGTNLSAYWKNVLSVALSTLKTADISVSHVIIPAYSTFTLKLTVSNWLGGKDRYVDVRLLLFVNSEVFQRWMFTVHRSSVRI